MCLLGYLSASREPGFAPPNAVRNGDQRNNTQRSQRAEQREFLASVGSNNTYDGGELQSVAIVQIIRTSPSRNTAKPYT